MGVGVVFIGGEARQHRLFNGQNKKCLHRNEDVHPYLCQLEQALELETKYRVAAGDNPGGEMLGGITSGMREGSAHVLRCLKVSTLIPMLLLRNMST